MLCRGGLTWRPGVSVVAIRRADAIPARAHATAAKLHSDRDLSRSSVEVLGRSPLPRSSTNLPGRFTQPATRRGGTNIALHLAFTRAPVASHILGLDDETRPVNNLIVGPTRLCLFPLQPDALVRPV